MLCIKNFLGTTLAASLLVAPAWAQSENVDGQNGGMTEQEMSDAEQASERMMGRLYVRELPTYWTPSEVVARLQELGYSQITDFDVEWNHYEVEALAPNGEEVEIEIDPVTGQILDIEENWF